MKVEKEMKYEVPEVTVLEVEVELGFAASPWEVTVRTCLKECNNSMN